MIAFFNARLVSSAWLDVCSTVWLNRAFTSSGEARIPAFDAGSQHGVGLFETIAARGGRPRMLEAHLDRLAVSARELHLSSQLRVDPLADAVEATLEKSGLGEARIDDVSVRVLERAGAGTPTTLVSTGGQPGGEPAAGSFPSPADLLTPRPAQPATAPATQPAAPPPTAAAAQPATAPATAWPGTNLGWPKLLGGSANEPPPGPGGGTIDPFKRARGS